MAKLDAFGPECLLLDLTLPDGSGVVVLEAARTTALSVKVAVISALEPGQSPFDALAPLNPDEVFQKPLGTERVHGWLSAQDRSSFAERRGKASRTGSHELIGARKGGPWLR